MSELPEASRSILESYGRPGSGLQRFEVRGMGTLNVVLLAGDDRRLLGKAAREAFEILERLEQTLSKFLPESDVSRVNTLGSERPIRVGSDLLAILDRARVAWEVSGGAFDPTVGPLLEAWGLVDMHGRIPEPDEVERLRQACGMHHVRVDADAGTVSLARRGVSLDLGAIGKGYAVDCMKAHLESRGIPAGAVISGRSTVATWGTPPGEERWRVEVVHPADPAEILCTLSVVPGALSSSGAYERYFRRGTRHYGHVLDPRSGRPVRTVEGVTVWTPDATLGDALSTALFVLGAGALASGDDLVARLVEAWPGAAAAAGPRVSVLLVEADASRWGGLRLETFHLGAPAFEEEG